MNRQEVENWIKEFDSIQELMKAFRIKTGWTLALIRNELEFTRFQLHSEPPESEDCGQIKCVVGKDFVDAMERALKFLTNLPGKA